MTTAPTKQTGWIIAAKSERDQLVALGIEVGPYNAEEGCFDSCVVSAEAMDRLDPLWGRFFWGLKPS